ncbi:membrane protein of ER body-like protein isoform X7 [Macadamia integrifolia]|uniref:membrane protein of ER body-like protein isoform X7 n=1 Tax=Macadamia integrifolia TaxID=60698 RepID=UPI001C4E68B1|nr:membrane protein of ER body-like protein isoform X7 [Macadamia integrifolia]
MEAAFMEEVEAEEGLVDNEAALKTRPRSRTTTSTAVTTSVEPVKGMEGDGFQQGGGGETERSFEPVKAMEGNGFQQGEGETERSVYFEGNDNNGVTMEEEVEAEEGLVDNEAALETRPHSRSTTTAVTIIVEPVKAMEENGSRQGGGGETERSIYFERGNEDGGIWKCRHCIWTYQMEGLGVDCMQKSKGHHNEPMTFTTLHGWCFGLGFEGIESNDRIPEEMPGNEKSDFSIEKADSQKSLVTGHGQKRDVNLKDSSLYDLHHLPSEKSESSFEPVDNGSGEDADVALLKDRRQEVAELDVERVILEQDTHDLYCPNCNSCITKRVILRKRKRTIRRIHYDAKREKIDTVVNLDGTNDESREVAESVLDSSPAHPVNDSNRDTGPDIFRCLSCFTYFIPTAARGFKLFQTSGNRDDRENIQNPGKISARNVKWFSSFFETMRGKNTAEQGDIATQPVEEDAEALSQTECLPETLPSKKMDHLSDKGVHLPMDVTTQHGEDKALIQSECLPEILPVQEKDNLSNQGGCSPVVLVDKNNVPVQSPKVVTVEESYATERIKVSAEEFQKDVRQVTTTTVTTTSMQEAVGLPGRQSNRGDDVAVSIRADQDVRDIGLAVPGRTHEWDILKSIIYGGLIESITSLGVVSSAAASDATTLNIVILGLANLMSGFIIIIHNLKELKYDYHGATSEANSNIDRYQETLGRRENFRLHAIVTLMSYIAFGLLPPVIYGFSFRRSNDKSYKLITCGAASLVAIILLSIGKAHVQRPPKSYIKTILHYLLVGLTASGLCYAVGLLIKRLLAESGWFDTLFAPSTAFLDTRSTFLETRSMKSGWAYYR